jgi:alkylhydroperoxidase family enzyme
MPRITPVPWPDLDPEIRELIETAQACRAVRNDTTVPRLWALRPELAKAQLPIQTRYHDSNILDGRLLELVRLRIATFNDCRACTTARKSDAVSEEDIACLSSDSGRFSEPERLALRFAELFAIDHERIDDELMSGLAEHFGPAEIVELGMYCGLMLGSGRFAYVMRGWADDEQPVVVHSRSATSQETHR